MKGKAAALALLAIILAVLHSYTSESAGGLNCSIVASGSCTTTPVLYMKNDSAGYLNAHAELPSVASYPYAVCCDALERNDTINTSCIDATFLKLNKTTDSHVETAGRSKYVNSACITAANGLLTCTYANDSCPANYECLTSIASSEAADNNETNAHVGGCDEYRTKICCGLNSPPNAPNLTAPANNTGITNMTPNFAWNASDPDGNEMEFDLYIMCHGGCSIDNRQYSGIAYANYTIPEELKYFGDDSYWYTWTVRAYDGTSYSQNASPFNFTLRSLVSLTLLNATVNFGSMQIGETNDTADNLPNPFALENDGNVFLDVNISAEDMLWQSQPSASSYFRYKADNYTSETGAFNSTASTADWTNVPESNQTFLKLFNYSNARDTAEIDILVQVPLDESAGSKSASITFTGKYVRVDI